MVDVLTVTLLDVAGIPVAELRDFESFEFTESVGPSGWSMTCPADVASDVAAGGGVMVADTGTGHEWSGHPVIVTDRDDGTATVSGNSDFVLLDTVVPHPEPDTLGTETNSHDVLTGPAGQVIADLIRRNAGIDAAVSRRRGWNVVEVGTAGTPSTTIRARWTPTLLGWVERKAAPNGVAVSVVADQAGSHTVTVRAVDTLTEPFAQELLSFGSWERVTTPPTVTHVWAGGSGEGIARLFRFGSAPDGPRIERFLDRRSAETADELDQEIVEALESGRRRSSLTVSAIDRDGLRYGREFKVGDLVPLWFEDQELIEPVTSVTTTLTGPDVDPARSISIGYPPVDITQRASAAGRRTATQLADLQGET